MAGTVLQALQWPVAIACGYAMGKAARSRGLSVWLAYGIALGAGLTTGLMCAAFTPSHERPWEGFLVWAAWSAFGTVHGWHSAPGLTRRQR